MRKGRDRPLADAGVVFLPVRKTPDATLQDGFFCGSRAQLANGVFLFRPPWKRLMTLPL